VALTLTTVANVLVTMALGPFVTALRARVFIGHRIPPRTWFAIAMAGVGIAWMYGGQMDLASHLGGTLVALLVPLAGACNWTVVQHNRSHGQKIDMVPAVLFPLAATPHDVGLLALLGLFQLAIPCVLSVLCAGVLKAPEVALLALLEVIFGILLAWFGANEVPAANVLTGGALVVGALVVNELIGWRQRACV
jgi:drug/metabolite transporter (DMT)-like permease